MKKHWKQKNGEEFTMTTTTASSPSSLDKVCLDNFLYLKGTAHLSENDLVEFFGPENVFDVNNHLKDIAYIVVNTVTFKKYLGTQQIIKGKKVKICNFLVDPSKKDSFPRLQKTERKVKEVEQKLAFSVIQKEIKVKNEVQVLAPRETKRWKIAVVNHSLTPIHFIGISIPRLRPEFKISDFPTASIELYPEKKYEFSVQFVAKTAPLGIFRQWMLLEFKECTIPLWVIVKVEDDQDFQLLRPQGEYQPPIIDEAIRETIPAFNMNRPNPSPFIEPLWKEKLEDYPIPEICQKQSDVLSKFSSMSIWKTKESFRELQHNLLWVEEHYLSKNIRMYDLKNVTFEEQKFVFQKGAYIPVNDSRTKITIPGLAEGRPCVYPHDIIYAWVVNTNVEYEGWIESVDRDSIQVIFCKDFHLMHPSNTLFNVRFSYSRIEMRYRHRAIDKVNMELIWPQNAPQAVKSSPPQFFDKLLDRNQRQAVEAFIYNYNKEVPFLLFGSFGTGKTRTIIEIIQQLSLVLQHTKVLICTKSNSSCDSIIRQLLDTIKPSKMFRLLPLRRPVEHISEDIRPYTALENGLTVPPTIEQIKSFDIIMTTCYSAHMLFDLGIGRDHFTHIIIDEAGQSLETDALIPLSLAKIGTSILLSGDDKQIGPTLYSPHCLQFKMDFSIMDRLCNLEVYRQRANRSCVIELQKNYHIDPLLTEFSSNTFYNGRIKTGVPNFKNSLTGWSKLKHKYPFFFYGVEGQDLREKDSPSFFNWKEASCVCHLIVDLLKEEGSRLKSSEIGIITPYYKQVKKLRLLLRIRYHLTDIKVGTPTEFQTSELRVLFISTVRSSFKWLKYDKKFNLGLIHNTKQFNTIINRASELLIVVGNPFTLAKDVFFKRFIHFCAEKGAFYGPEINDQNMKQREEREASKYDEETEQELFFVDEYGCTGDLDLEEISKRFEQHSKEYQPNQMGRFVRRNSSSDSLIIPLTPFQNFDSNFGFINGNEKYTPHGSGLLLDSAEDQEDEGGDLISGVLEDQEFDLEDDVIDLEEIEEEEQQQLPEPKKPASSSLSGLSFSPNARAFSPLIPTNSPLRRSQEDFISSFASRGFDLHLTNPHNPPTHNPSFFNPTPAPPPSLQEKFIPVYAFQNVPILYCEIPSLLPHLSIEHEGTYLCVKISIFHCLIERVQRANSIILSVTPQRKENTLYLTPDFTTTNRLLLVFGELFQSAEVSQSPTLMTINLPFKQVYS